METEYFKVPDEVIYQLVPEGLMVVHMERGETYYFNRESKFFFEFFRTSRTLNEFLDAEGSEEITSELSYLKEFCDSLLLADLVRPESQPEQTDGMRIHYERPVLLGKGHII